MDLVDRSQKHLMVGGLVTLVGVLMVLFGAPKNVVSFEQLLEAAPLPPEQPPCERDLKLDPYRLWLANKYEIERNEVFDRFVFNDHTFEKLDDALESAHAVELEGMKKLELERVERAAQLLDQQGSETASTHERESKSMLIYGALIFVLCLPGLSLFYFGWQDQEASVQNLSVDKQKTLASISQTWNLKFPDDWQFISNSNVQSAADTGWTFCDERSGTLTEFTTSARAIDAVQLIDKALGEGNNPWKGVASSGNIEKRTYILKNGSTLRLTAFESTAYLCETYPSSN